jgi:hypothetical protein
MRTLAIVLIVLAGCSRTPEQTRIEGASVQTGAAGGLEAAIGIAAGERLMPVLAAGCHLPCVSAQTIRAASGSQTFIRFRLHQGNDGGVATSRALGTYEISWAGTDSPPPEVEVTFTADARGAWLRGTNASNGVVLRASRVEAR